MILILTIQILIIHAEWKLIDSVNFKSPNNFKDWNIQNLQLEYTQSNEQVIVLKENQQFISKPYSQKVQAIQLIIDVQNVNFNTQPSSLEVKIIEENQNTHIIDQQFDISNQINNENSILNLKSQVYQTIIVPIQDITTINFKIFIIFNQVNSENQLLIKNILLYGYFCPKYCKNCNINGNCLDCYFQSNTLPCSCPSDTMFQQENGCVTECQRNNHLSVEKGNECLFDDRIKQKFYFLSDEIMEGFPIYPNNYEQLKPEYTVFSNGLEYFGYFTNQQVVIELYEEMKVTLIRIRMNLRLQNFKDSSQLKFYINSAKQYNVEFKGDQFQLFYYTDQSYKTSRWIYLQSYEDLSNEGDLSILARIELVIQKKPQDTQFIIEGSQVGSISRWAISNVTIDTFVCKLNCYICQDSYTCAQCQFGYFLYQSECVQSCPIHTTNCIDYELEIPISSYLVKSFYNSNMTLDQIKSHYDSVVYSNNNPFSSQMLSFINNKLVLGGLLVWNNAKFTKTYTISTAHYAISLRFNITFGDDFSGTFNYYIDSNVQEPITRTPSLSDKNLIGKSSAETIQFVYKYFTHSSGTLKIDLECSTSQDIKDGFCAISEYFIVVHKCVSTCESCTSLDVCTSGTVTTCLAPSFWSYDLSSSQYVCMECPLSNCLQCVNNVQCKACTFEPNNKYSLIQGQCICDSKYQRNIKNGQCQCTDGYYDDPLNYNCLSICGDQIVVQGEECDDGNLIPFDGCSQFCLKECVNCKIGYCKAGMCSKCNSGYYLDVNQQCTKTQCGDLIIIKPEQCDDGNLVINDGCSDCLCEQGWQEKQNGCQSICGDGLIVKGEQCDDGNSIQYDGCYNCKYDCNRECEICDFGHCQKCKYGFNLINNNCINTCGDGILNRATEECDDNNNLPRDGCYNCKLEQGFLCFDYNLIFKGCQRCSDTNCENCILEKTIEKCQFCQSGYYLSEKSQCQKCDQICIDCIKTSKNCINYNYNIYQIKECDNNKGVYYNFELRDCIPLCGDGIIQGNEQCDDKNIDNFDGCSSQCQIEKGYLFDSETKQIINEPKIKAEFKSTNNFYYSIKADQYQESINCTASFINIELFNQTDFNFTTQESDSNCNLEIQYFKSIKPSNLIHIFVAFKGQYKKRLIQEMDQQSSQEIIVIPSGQPYASQEQKEQGQKVADASKTISQSLLVLGPMAILAGGFKFIWAILDILSWLNKFYFLNVTYPENVRQLFLQAEWSNIIDLPSMSYFNNPDDLYYFQAPLKFSEKGIDPLFFNNIQTVIFFIFQVIITKTLCLCFVRIIKFFYSKTIFTQITTLAVFKLGETDQQCQQDQNSQESAQDQLKIPKFFLSLYRKCIVFEQCFLANLLKTIQISFLDLILAIVLQICSQETSNFLVVKVNTIIAYIMMVVLFYILYFSYQISITHKLQLESKYFSMRYNSFYEDINTDSNLAMLYSFINLIRKTMFIVSTVVFYYQPIYQTFFCFMSSFLNIFILVQHNPFKKKQQYLLNFVPDFCVVIVTAIAVIFAFQDAFLFFEEELIYKLGWVIVGFIYLSIAVQLLFFIKQLLETLWEKSKSLFNYCRQRCCANKVV